jgi:serine/threonine protein phosphatase 1
MGRTFVMGDIHGAFRALKQCLERSRFDRTQDTLICLGDVCDGWPETREAIDELLTIPNLIYLFGNHDFWTLAWMQSGLKDPVWLSQGGQATVDSYGKKIPPAHEHFLNTARPFYLLDNLLFVHAGVDPMLPLEAQELNTLLWDRKLARLALDFSEDRPDHTFGTYEAIFLGHTPVGDQPRRAGNVWLMDTGAGWAGPLSMMDIHTHEIIQSDPVPMLYPGIAGRKRR